MVRTRPSTRDPGLIETGRPAIHLVHEPADIQTFAELYRCYLAPVYHYCAHRLPTLEDAEDATSLVFTKALSTLSTQRDPSSLRSWLFSIAHNVVVDHYRARKSTLAFAALGPVGTADGESPELQALATETVRSLLAQLPAEQARIVELRLAGLTRPEIAQVLGKSSNAVKVAQFRAYARLRDLIGGSLGADPMRVQGEPA